MSVELAKGTRVIPPEEALVREDVLNVIRKTFERYGFRPLETPILQRFESLTAKYAGGAEIVKEIFQLKDQGNRELALRYDLTVPLALFVGLNPNEKLPLKRYEVGKVFRDGPIKRGRTREFWQCDADIVGATSIVADGECIRLAQDVFQELGLDVQIKVNNVKILKCVAETFWVELYGELPTNEDLQFIILTLDKLGKIGKKGIIEEFVKKYGQRGRDFETMFFTTLGDYKNKSLESLKEYMIGVKENKKRMNLPGKELQILGFDELQEILKYIKEVEFDPTLARGLSYYTGNIFEIYVVNSEMTSSVASGGRFDRMIGKYANRDFPAVGVSFGLEPIAEAIKEQKKERRKTSTQVFIAPIVIERIGAKKQEDIIKETFVLAEKLRKENINTEVDLMERVPAKNIEYANAMNIPFIVFLGENEVKEKKYKLRDLNARKEILVSVKELVEQVQNARKVSS